MYGYMQDRGVEVLGMTWAAPEEYLEYRNGGQALKPGNIEDYARFLTSSVQYLADHGVHIMCVTCKILHHSTRHKVFLQIVYANLF